MTMKHCLRMLAVLLLFGIRHSYAQQSSANIYEMYASQYSDLLKVRGVPDTTIFRLLAEYKDQNIHSDQNFADILGSLYGKQDSIGILFYSFDKDVLTRVFFEPGKVIERKTIPITSLQLLQLNKDIEEGMQLGKLAANRAPQMRGTIANNQAAPKKDLALAFIRARSILLPDPFDEKYRQLIIVPALNIGSFPFHALKPYGTDKYLIDRANFFIAPGLIDLISLRTQVLNTLNNKTTKWENGKLVSEYGTVRYTAKLKFSIENAVFVSNPAYPTHLEYIFPDLPGAKTEVTNAIPYASRYHLYEGAKAVKDSVMKYWNTSDLFYFATHGIASNEMPMEESYLVLSGDKPKLTAKEIMGMYAKRPAPEMVILSACQTGLGKSLGAGIAGLARSFILAGSRHVIMSLWNVDDESTAYLMNRFIYHLQTPHQYMPAEPLRLAVLDAKTKYPDPVHWASFSLLGISY